ncbi:MAG: protein kinase [Bryobacteraceae bacterium]|nr:protein kinase [Bryobacteraceae bacterium]
MDDGERRRWADIKAVFDQAAELAPEDRRRYLEQRCASDRGLIDEVSCLLDVSDRAGDFLERPASESLAGAPGQVLGNYRVVSEIGWGGSAVVYLAERADGLFQKRVAIKILRTGVFGDDPRRRFQRERQMLAELDHPNIVRLWDGGVTADGRPYLVEDYVDGPPVTEYARSQELSLTERVNLFLPVCDAVEFAHGKGIVHRDIKPENILTTAGGMPKLVDFGIARLCTNPIDAGRTAAPMWTPAYGAPEQARGDEVTPRSDIYSLAMVLSELLLGRPAVDVRGMDPVAAAQAVCHRQPELSRLPPGLAAAIGKALRKQPGDRHASVAELAGELRAWLEHGDSWRHRLARYRTPFAGVTLAAVAIAGLFWLSGRARPAPAVELLSLPVTADPDIEGVPSVSPDGRRVLYEVRTYGRRAVWMKDLDSGQARRLAPLAAPNSFPSWSPDGTSILFSRVDHDRLDLLVMRPGEGPRLVHRLHGTHFSSVNARWAVWAADGSILYVDRKGEQAPWAIFRLPPGGVPFQVTFPASNQFGDLQAAPSPDGRWTVFARYSSGTEVDLYLIPAEGGEPRRLTWDSTYVDGMAWTPDSREIIYGARRSGPVWTLWRLKIAGQERPERIAGAEPNASWPSVVSSPRGGLRIAYHHENDHVNIRRWDDPGRAGSSPVWVAPSTRFDSTPQYSPDGKRIAFASSRSGFREIWVCEEDGSGLRQLTHTNGPYTDAPRWSPDGRRIAFSSAEGDNRDVFIVDAASRVVRRLTNEPTNEGRPAFSADGRWLYYRSNRSGSEQIWKMPSEGGESRQVTRGGAWESIESPDGRYLYFAKPRPTLGIWRVAPDGGSEEQVAEGVREGLWGVTREGISYITVPSWELRRVRFGSTQPEILARIAVPVGGIYSGFSVRADGRSYLFPQTAELISDIMLLDGVPLR